VIFTGQMLGFIFQHHASHMDTSSIFLANQYPLPWSKTWEMWGFPATSSIIPWGRHYTFLVYFWREVEGTFWLKKGEADFPFDTRFWQ